MIAAAAQVINVATLPEFDQTEVRRIISKPGYVACVSLENQDDFDYSCQQLIGPEIIFGSVKPFILSQSWGSRSTGAAIWFVEAFTFPAH
jgi:hypothetical protein